ncbi:MAG: indole-3-glycerol phosphate synthase [Herbinix sp.]|jgi:indole-3-glycerol phosphate synthase|nr:indole-3-glycerol phosphate synthase [Herbinix sp.]
MILDTIAEATRIRVDKAKERLPLNLLKERIYTTEGIKSFHSRDAFAFERALRKTNQLNRKGNGISFICEVKKASPSKGVITEDFPYLTIAKDYEEAGADAISVLTEPDFFQGEDHYLSEISKMVSIPVLRKDFIIDEYQIYEAKLLGADAVLLICSLLDTVTIQSYLKICDELGLTAMVEAHSEIEIISAIRAGARVIGVNNRNLKTFEVDITNSQRLRRYVPQDIIFVAESGIRSAADISVLYEAGVDAVLIGETLMRSSNRRVMLDQLRVQQ